MLRNRINELFSNQNNENEIDNYDKFISIVEKLKYCNKCEQYLFKEQFRGKSYCIPCFKIYRENYRKEHIQKTINNETNKRFCKQCNKTKSLDEFFKTALTKCKECSRKKQREYSKRYYHKNKSSSNDDNSSND